MTLALLVSRSSTDVAKCCTQRAASRKHCPRYVPHAASAAAIAAVVSAHVTRTDADAAAAFPQGSVAAILSGRFDFAPPTQAAPRDPTRAAEHAVGAARRDGASIVLGARKFLVTEADHCDLLAVSAAPGGGVPLGVFLAAVPFGAVAVLFR